MLDFRVSTLKKLRYYLTKDEQIEQTLHVISFFVYPTRPTPRRLVASKTIRNEEKTLMQIYLRWKHRDVNTLEN